MLVKTIAAAAVAASLVAPAVGATTPADTRYAAVLGIARLHDPVAIARRAAALQAADVGVTVTTPTAPRHASPAAAAAAIARRHSMNADAVHDLDRLPAHVAGPLTEVLDAYLAYADARGLGAILGARVALLDAGLRLSDATEGQAMATSVSLCPALAIDLTEGPSTYTADCALVVDAYGADTYLNNAGGGGCLTPVSAALLDLDGDDTYAARAGCAGNGGGALGAGFLLDTDGNDAYTPDANVSNGSGHETGPGMLVDTDGDDVYDAPAGINTSNGSGFAGIGTLLDLDGDDSYEGQWVTNGSGYLGSGLLFDLRGVDSYSGTSAPITGTATNGAGNLGAGLLLDAGGTGDTYTDDSGSGTDQTVVPKGIVGAQVDTQL